MNIQKLANLGCAAALVAVGAWASIRFGPRPDISPAGSATPAAVEKSAAPSKERLPSSTSAAASNTEVRVARRFDNIPGLKSQSGNANEAPDDYLSRFEAIYRRRGYELAAVPDIDRTTGKRGQSGPLQTQHAGEARLYWRGKVKGAEVLAAEGPDADPLSEQSNSTRQVFITVAVPSSGGGTDWTAYRYVLQDGRLPTMSGEGGLDMPGTDPPDVPRYPGLRLILGYGSPGGAGGGAFAVYSSRDNHEALARWYVGAMSKEWTLDANATAQANQIASGTLCFNRGERFCVIWIKQDRENELSTVIISTH